LLRYVKFSSEQLSVSKLRMEYSATYVTNYNDMSRAFIWASCQTEGCKQRHPSRTTNVTNVSEMSVILVKIILTVEMIQILLY
jgi:hypothetical protein